MMKQSMDFNSLPWDMHPYKQKNDKYVEYLTLETENKPFIIGLSSKYTRFVIVLALCAGKQIIS